MVRKLTALSIFISGLIIVDATVEHIFSDSGSHIPAGWGWSLLPNANAAPNWTCWSNSHCSTTQSRCMILGTCGGGGGGGSWGTWRGPDDTGSGGGGGPDPVEDPSDLNGDGISDCWQDLYSSNAQNPNLSRDWGWRQRDDGRWDFHAGWDIGLAGQSNVDARFIAGSRVLEVGFDSTRGNWGAYITIQDLKVIVYYHLDKVNVSQADIKNARYGLMVSRGDSIGTIGKTGSGGSIHLHMMVFPTLANYTAYKNEISRAANENEKARVSIKYSMDPADLFNSSICQYPGTVNSSNNGLTP